MTRTQYAWPPVSAGRSLATPSVLGYGGDPRRLSPSGVQAVAAVMLFQCRVSDADQSHRSPVHGTTSTRYAEAPGTGSQATSGVVVSKAPWSGNGLSTIRRLRTLGRTSSKLF